MTPDTRNTAIYVNQKKKMNSFYIHTLGCKVNWCDSEKIAETAVKHGCTRVSDPCAADFCILNTCTVTSQADATARKLIRKFRKNNLTAPIFVSGCYARTDSETLKSISEISLVIESDDSERIFSEIESFLSKFTPLSEKNYNPVIANNLYLYTNRTRAFIKIQDGCNRFCAYCKIPYARGRARSIPLNTIIDELKKLAENDVKEVVITGINIAAYNYKSNFLSDMLKKISKLKAIPRIRLSSVEAIAITEELCEIFAESEVLMPHIHIPLQSGSNKVLKLMNRKISVEDVENAADRFLSVVHNGVITTDVIVGMPGEEEEDFEKTIQVVKRIPFGKVHIFQYSPREGTAAVKLKKLFVQPSEIKKREKKLIDCANKTAEKCRQQFDDKKLKILIEHNNKGYWEGFSENYLRVKSSLNNLKQNEIVELDMNNPENVFEK